MNLKEALEYVVGLSKPNIYEIEDREGKKHKFSDRSLKQVEASIPILRAGDVIQMNTLTSLLDYIKGKIDSMPGKMIVQVCSPTEVRLYSQLNVNRDREDLVAVTARVPSFSFDKFMDKETFTIALQSKFIDEHDRALVLKFSGTVEDGTVTEYGDDGVSQKASVKTGIASKSDAIVPNPVKLKPYRTFLEVEQPESDFIFRMKSDKYDGIQCAIFEADGGAWTMEATKRIKEYLQEELKEFPDFTVIS